MTDLNCLTTKEVAQICRVSDATVERWAEAGLLKSKYTSDGHQWFDAREVAQFEQVLIIYRKSFTIE